mmetsp:Transcript_50425/g.155815  ORF Transcript_50425/g.155815 Transcript_50425/m.155815 type:complete len:236 (-) Transcript_50425:792-1499(-)
MIHAPPVTQMMTGNVTESSFPFPALVVPLRGVSPAEDGGDERCVGVVGGTYTSGACRRPTRLAGCCCDLRSRRSCAALSLSSPALERRRWCLTTGVADDDDDAPSATRCGGSTSSRRMPRPARSASTGTGMWMSRYARLFRSRSSSSSSPAPAAAAACVASRSEAASAMSAGVDRPVAKAFADVTDSSKPVGCLAARARLGVLGPLPPLPLCCFFTGTPGDTGPLSGLLLPPVAA